MYYSTFKFCYKGSVKKKHPRRKNSVKLKILITIKNFLNYTIDRKFEQEIFVNLESLKVRGAKNPVNQVCKIVFYRELLLEGATWNDSFSFGFFYHNAAIYATEYL